MAEEGRKIKRDERGKEKRVSPFQIDGSGLRQEMEDRNKKIKRIIM